MRLVLPGSALSLLAISLVLVGCPDKQEEKTTPAAEKVEVERAEPDEEGKGVEKVKDEKVKKIDKPAAPAAAAAGDDKKDEDGKAEGGW